MNGRRICNTSLCADEMSALNMPRVLGSPLRLPPLHLLPTAARSLVLFHDI